MTTTITQHEFDTTTRVCKHCGKDSKDATPTNCFERSIQVSTDLVEMVKKLQIGQEEDRKRQEEDLKRQEEDRKRQEEDRKRQDEELKKLLQEQQTMLLLVAQSAMDPWGKTSTHRTESESKTVRNLVIKYYDLPERKSCQILMNLSQRPHPHVVNLHIWPEHAAASLSYHVNRAIERKFDNKELTFELRENELCLKVLNPAILNMQLEGSDQTFSQVNRLPLVFPNGSHPFRRLLAAHSIQCHRLARAKGWIKEHEQTDAQVQAEALARHSLDKEAQYRLRRFLNLQDNKLKEPSTSHSWIQACISDWNISTDKHWLRSMLRRSYLPGREPSSDSSGNDESDPGSRTRIRTCTGPGSFCAKASLNFYCNDECKRNYLERRRQSVAERSPKGRRTWKKKLEQMESEQPICRDSSPPRYRLVFPSPAGLGSGSE
eukprot:g44921.t1